MDSIEPHGLSYETRYLAFMAQLVIREEEKLLFLLGAGSMN